MAAESDNNITMPLTVFSWLQHAELALRRQLLQDEGTDGTLELSSTPPLPTSPPVVVDPSQSRGRTVLTILYLCVLALCFVVPVFYYFRLHCFEEQARRELEQFDAEAFHATLEQSEQHREESRAARRKYIEERRARILQLFQPVRMTLKKENFPHLMGEDVGQPPDIPATAVELPPPTKKLQDTCTLNTPRSGETATVGSGVDGEEESQQHESSAGAGLVNESGSYDGDLEAQQDQIGSQTYGDDDNFFVRLPLPGLQMGGSHIDVLFRTNTDSSNNSNDNNSNSAAPTRLVPGLCTICLCTYKVGSDVVWSSNEACEHVFHKGCIEQWLMKQREGPLCPCCRRDFIVDPFDLEDTGIDMICEDQNNSNDHGTDEALVLVWDAANSDIEMNATSDTEVTSTAAVEQVTVVAVPSESNGDANEGN